MLQQPTLEQLDALKLSGMRAALAEQAERPDIDTLSFDERLALLVEREALVRADRQLSARLRRARLRHPEACLEDIDYRSHRGLKRTVIEQLATSRWIREHLNVLITGPTGVGKSWLACAFAQKACRDGYGALYARLPQLLGELALAREDGTWTKRFNAIARAQVLVLDDLGLSPMNELLRRELLELLEDRYQRRSTIVTSQLAVTDWHAHIGDPTLADAILDRLVHNAHRISLHGESMRKTLGAARQQTESID